MNEPSVKGENIIIKTVNQINKKEIENIGGDILSYLKKELENHSLNLKVIIEKNIKKNDTKSLNNEEKMKLFLEKKLEYNKIFDIVPLSESPHIKYLETKDKNVFYNYHNIVNKDPKTPSCNKEYSIERFDKLIKSILESNNCNYNITIKNNLITDGCHRASILYFYL